MTTNVWPSGQNRDSDITNRGPAIVIKSFYVKIDRLDRHCCQLWIETFHDSLIHCPFKKIIALNCFSVRLILWEKLPRCVLIFFSSVGTIMAYLGKLFRNTFLFELTNNISANREVWPLKDCVKQIATTLHFRIRIKIKQIEVASHRPRHTFHICKCCGFESWP